MESMPRTTKVTVITPHYTIPVENRPIMHNHSTIWDNAQGSGEMWDMLVVTEWHHVET